MIELTLAEVADAVGGQVRGDGAVVVASVTTDSRDLGDRGLFVARRGEVTDGHRFAADAVRAGAVAVLAERPVDGVGPQVPVVLVEDSDAALGELGAAVRRRVAPLVVGITGSVGKTTTKDLVRAACAADRPTVAARGSYNNEVGVPLTLLQAQSDTRVLVVEMGARGPGHVAALAELARPDVGIVTAVAGVHLELFGTLDDVARAKGELPASLPPDGTCILNADDRRVADMATAATVLRCSAAGATGADLVAEDVVLDARARARFRARTPWGDADVALPVAGRHQVANALFALAAAGAAGVAPERAAAALADAVVSPWRGAVVEVGGVVILDDAYNANPTSTVAALETLAEMEVHGQRVAVLGIMAEIGDDHEAEHWRVGLRAGGRVDRLVVVGTDADPIAVGAREAGLSRVQVVPDAEAAVAATPTSPGDAVLVKASRVAGLDRTVAGLRARLEAGEVAT